MFDYDGVIFLLLFVDVVGVLFCEVYVEVRGCFIGVFKVYEIILVFVGLCVV